MRAGLAAWLWIAAGGVLIAAFGCGPEFVAGTGGNGGDGAAGNAGGGGTGAGGAGGSGGGPCMTVDADGDGASACDDCDDDYVLARPGAAEICDGVDNDCDGEGDPASCMDLGTFVSPTGDDDDPGTRDQPVRTIAKAIANAGVIGAGTTVYIAEGSYGESVTLVPGVSLLGGHALPTWRPDPADHPSTIDCSAVDYTCVRAGAGVGRSDVIDGLTIQGRGGEPPNPPGSVAVALDSASPTIRNSRIIGGGVTGMINGAERSIAVHVLGQPAGGVGPLLEGNEIVSGEAPNDASIGVLIEAMAGAEIVNNDITSGPGVSSYGIVDSGAIAGTEIVRNRILAGDAAALGAAFGITTRGAPRIAQNFINADPNDPPTCEDVTLWCGGIASYSSAARIENNVVFGALARQSVAIHLSELDAPAAGDVHVNANFLNAFGNAATEPTAKSAAIALGSPYTGAVPGSQFAVIRNNILIGGRNQSRYGVYEETVINQTCSPKAFTNNLIFFASGMSGVLYRQWNGTTGANIGMLMNLPAAYTGNLSQDPLVDPTFHLMDGSPCIDAGTEIDAPSLDFEGDPRVQGGGFDIGPDEAQ